MLSVIFLMITSVSFAGDYDLKICQGQKASICINNVCPTSKDIHCQRKCREGAKKKCVEESLKPIKANWKF